MFRLWTQEGGQERADSIIAAMKCRLPDTDIGTRMPELQLRFGCVPASDIDPAEQIRIRLQIKSLSAQGSRHPDEAIHWNIAKELWRVAQEVIDLHDSAPSGLDAEKAVKQSAQDWADGYGLTVKEKKALEARLLRKRMSDPDDGWYLEVTLPKKNEPGFLYPKDVVMPEIDKIKKRRVGTT